MPAVTKPYIWRQTCLNKKKSATVVILVSIGSIYMLWRILVEFVHPCYLPIALVKPKVFLDEFHRKTCKVISRSPNAFKMETLNPEMKHLEQHYIMLSDARGRVGNMMFQIAGAYGYASVLGYKLYLEESHPLLPYFDLQPSGGQRPTNVIELMESDCRGVVWKCFRDVLTHNLTLNGWFQSWKYFNHISETIRAIFTIKPYYLREAETFLKSNVPENTIIIGIHVRRGDLLMEERINCGNFVASVGYINRAMDYFRSRFSSITFVVVSEDIGWCKENIISPNVIYSPFEEPVIDLAIMTLCHHMIITVGTFGWWGAYLGGGQTVYVKEFPTANSWLDNFGMYKEDYYPPGWIGISNFD